MDASVTETADEARWRAVRERDARLRGDFVYGVLTTGIYCRPGCPSRTPRRENLVFFAGPDAARAAGLRPCRRCRPDAAGVPDWFEAACRELAEPGARVAAVAAAAGVSRSTLHRSCLAILGVTPTALRRAAAGERLRAALAESGSVLEACLDAGFGAVSTAYEETGRRLGVPPGALRGRGAELRLSWGTGTGVLGPMVAAATARGLCLLEFLEDDETPEARVRSRFPNAELRPAGPDEARRLAAAIGAVAVPDRARSLPRDLQGTAFQLRVWAALEAIAPGERVSYAELAARLGRPEATRAVAQAVGRNPLAVLVPCHRVVGSDGALRGYRWGLERKAALLARESGGNDEDAGG